MVYKRVINFILSFLIIFSCFPGKIFASEITKEQRLAVQSQYSATVYKYILNKNIVEKIEDGMILLIALYPKADFTKEVDTIQKDTEEIYKTNKCKSIFSGLPDDANSIKVLADGGNQEDFINAIVKKIKFLYDNYSDIKEDNALKYTAILYIENYTKKLREISNIASEELKEIYSEISNNDSEIIKLKEKLISLKATNLLVTKSDDNFLNTESGIGSETLSKTFLQKVNQEYYFTNELLIGKALSATYIPFRTNKYDNPNCDIPSSENYKKFDSKYGELRKALFISTNNKSVSQYYVTGKVSSYKPAILRDFIENLDEEKLFITDPLIIIKVR